MDFDLKKEQANSAQASGMTAEQVKQIQEQASPGSQREDTVKSAHEKLTVAKTAAMPAILTRDCDPDGANQMDLAADLIWFRLGDAYRMSLQANRSRRKQKRFETSATDYQKAIELRNNSELAEKKSGQQRQIAAYYNNLAEVYFQVQQDR